MNGKGLIKGGPQIHALPVLPPCQAGAGDRGQAGRELRAGEGSPARVHWQKAVSAPDGDACLLGSGPVAVPASVSGAPFTTAVPTGVGYPPARHGRWRLRPRGRMDAGRTCGCCGSFAPWPAVTSASVSTCPVCWLGFALARGSCGVLGCSAAPGRPPQDCASRARGRSWLPFSRRCGAVAGEGGRPRAGPSLTLQ